jgi:hypothetical protein
MIRALAAIACLSWGCQLLNTSDPPKPFVADAGVDAASLDGGPLPPEANCEDGADNDMDGLTDCVDYDCSDDPECCATHPDVALFDWSTAPGSQFYSLGSVPETGPCGSFETPRCLTSFGSGTAMIRRCHGSVCEVMPVCDPIGAGYTVRVVFIPKGGASASHAAVVLTPTPELQTGTAQLVDDLAIAVLANGTIEVTQARAVLARAESGVGVGEPITLEVAIGPSTENGRAVLRATVTHAATDRVLLDRHPFLLASELVREDGCEEIGGLYFGIEGRGSGVFVEQVTVTELECTNPSDFVVPENIDQRGVLVTHDESTPPLPATHVDLGFDAWSYGGIASPSLALVDVPGRGDQWEVYVDATDVDRSVELFADVGFAIGRARTTNPNDWRTWDLTEGDPDSGIECRPSCIEPLPAMCTCGDSAREPSSTPGCVARAEGPVEGPYHITLDETNVFDDPECPSERDPALAPMGPGSTNHWLFYTCEQPAMPSHIRMVEVRCGDGGTLAGTPILMPAALGSFAAGGVRAPEVLATVRPSMEAGPPAVYSLWFLARDLAGKVSVGLALAEAREDEAVPAFAPYPANPVLAHANVRQDVPCTDCRITGLAVAPLGISENSLRFLVARTVNDSGTLRYELVPLDQAWSNPYGD